MYKKRWRLWSIIGVLLLGTATLLLPDRLGVTFYDVQAQTDVNGRLSVSDDVIVGDPNISYNNPEFSVDGQYMIWFEPTGETLGNGDRVGTVWHSGIDPETGDLIPADGRGFAAFETTFYKRANPGFDSEGTYYVGADPSGQLFFVRPTGPTSGNVIELPTAPDPDRRGIFPSKIPGSEDQFVFWFKANPGPHPRLAETVEVRLISLDNPTEVILIESQQNIRPGVSWTAIDLAVPRWVIGLPEFTFGFRTRDALEVRRVRVEADGTFETQDITRAKQKLYDPSPYFFDNRRYIFPGVDGTTTVQVFREDTNGVFRPYLQLAPQTSYLSNPCRALSNEPFVVQDRLYTTFLLSDCDSASGGSFFSSRGEVFVAVVDADVPTWVESISLPTDAYVINEPEVVSTGEHAWVFYSAYPVRESPLTATYQLRRVQLQSN